MNEYYRHNGWDQLLIIIHELLPRDINDATQNSMFGYF